MCQGYIQCKYLFQDLIFETFKNKKMSSFNIWVKKTDTFEILKKKLNEFL